MMLFLWGAHSHSPPTDAHLHFMAINEQPPTLFIMLLMMIFCVHGKVVAFFVAYPGEQKRGSIQCKQLLPICCFATGDLIKLIVVRLVSTSF
jgi:hypothetical protein